MLRGPEERLVDVAEGVGRGGKRGGVREGGVGLCSGVVQYVQCCTAEVLCGAVLRSTT